jgi:Ca2+:H+ antiporter
MHASAIVVFVLSAIAIIPLSGILGAATEELAGHTGATIGGLINATLGNFAELVIAGIALRAGLLDLVKASITGSILGNLLLVLGAAQFAGGLRYRSQAMNRNLASVSSTLLMVAVLGLVMPAVFHAVHPDPLRLATHTMSVWVAVLLIAAYALSLVYSMYTHRSVFSEGGDVAHHETPPSWSVRKSLLVLVAAAAATAMLSEFLVGSTEEATRSMGLSQMFVGLVLIPIIGNAAEHSSAVLMALKNRMDLAVSISVGSAIQVALLVAPVLVLLGVLFGQPLDLAFTLMEVASVAVAVAVASSVMKDSESNWLEGSFLLVAYAIMGVAFFYY